MWCVYRVKQGEKLFWLFCIWGGEFFFFIFKWQAGKVCVQDLGNWNPPHWCCLCHSLCWWQIVDKWVSIYDSGLHWLRVISDQRRAPLYLEKHSLANKTEKPKAKHTYIIVILKIQHLLPILNFKILDKTKLGPLELKEYPSNFFLFNKIKLNTWKPRNILSCTITHVE